MYCIPYMYYSFTNAHIQISTITYKAYNGKNNINVVFTPEIYYISLPVI